MQHLRFDNRFVRELPGDPLTEPQPRQVHGALYSKVQPTPVSSPRLLAYAKEVAELLGVPDEDVRSEIFPLLFAGNTLVEGMQPYAANYGGHQFGNWAGQLGDGRAITLGELVNARSERYEIQLKGAGRTPYSRTADGRAVLRSSVREFLCSEAMHHLGIPTTRALCLIATGEDVIRDMFYDGNAKPEPGAIVCRVAPSFIRFGNFELPASRRDVALLDRLVTFTIMRDFPELVTSTHAANSAEVRAKWFETICERTAILIAHWMRVGFVHGVMNTDNMSILGLTIDYGPYGWMDDYDRNFTPNTTDAQMRRYRFGNQPQIAYWNLGCLAGALAPLFETHDPLHAALEHYVNVYNAADRANVAAKLGLAEFREADAELIASLYTFMETSQVDMAIFFRALADIDTLPSASDPLTEAFYDPQKYREARGALDGWLASYRARIRDANWPSAERRARMNSVNPRYVLRNYLAQQAIDRAEQGDYAGIHELLDVVRRPYDDQPGHEAYAARRPDWARHRAGCAMLS
jgi:uncharacterized protein YdiU (UPF0061 family)